MPAHHTTGSAPVRRQRQAPLEFPNGVRARRPSYNAKTGRWVIEYCAADGASHWVYGASEALAWDAFRAKLDLVDQNRSLDAPENLTLDRFVEGYWMPQSGGAKRPWGMATRRKYEILYRTGIRPYLGHAKLREIRTHHLIAALDSYLADLRRRPGSTRDGVPSRNQTLTIYRAVFAYAQVLEDLTGVFKNPSAKVRQLEHFPKQVPVRTASYHAWLRRLPVGDDRQQRTNALVVLGAVTGARPGELLAVQWRDIAPQVDGSGRWTIQRHQSGPRTRPVSVDGRKGHPLGSVGATVEVYVPPVAMAALEVHRGLQAALRLRAGRKWQGGNPTAPDAVLFTNSLGGLQHVATFDQWWSRERAKYDLPAGLTPHSLRHFLATDINRLGGSGTDIAAQLGHTDGGVTAMRVYTAPSEAKSRRLVTIVADTLTAGLDSLATDTTEGGSQRTTRRAVPG